MKKIDYKAFQAKMNAWNPDHPVTEEEAAEALRNLGELVLWTCKINQREHIIPMEELVAMKTQTVEHNQQESPINKG
jgi:hypothetical protein